MKEKKEKEKERGEKVKKKKGRKKDEAKKRQGALDMLSKYPVNMIIADDLGIVYEGLFSRDLVHVLSTLLQIFKARKEMRNTLVSGILLPFLVPIEIQPPKQKNTSTEEEETQQNQEDREKQQKQQEQQREQQREQQQQQRDIIFENVGAFQTVLLAWWEEMIDHVQHVKNFSERIDYYKSIIAIFTREEFDILFLTKTPTARHQGTEAPSSFLDVMGKYFVCGYKIVLHLASCLNHPDFRPASKILHLFTDILSFLLLFIPSLCEILRGGIEESYRRKEEQYKILEETGKKPSGLVIRQTVDDCSIIETDLKELPMANQHMSCLNLSRKLRKMSLEEKQNSYCLINYWPALRNIQTAVLKNNPQVASLDKKMKNLNPKWIQIFFRNKDMYYTLIKKSTRHCCILLKSDYSEIDWSSVPSFHSLIKYLLIDISNFSTEEYSKILLGTTKHLSKCGALFSLFVTYLFRATNVHQTSAAVSAMQLISTWLKGKKELPPNFKLSEFIKAIAICLASEHYEISTNILVFIYQNDRLLGKGARGVVLVRLLLGSFFWKYFLHWDADVREAYQRIILYKISGVLKFCDQDPEIEDLLQEAVQKRDLLLTQAQLQIKKPVISSHIPILEEQMMRKRRATVVDQEGGGGELDMEFVLSEIKTTSTSLTTASYSFSGDKDLMSIISTAVDSTESGTVSSGEESDENDFLEEEGNLNLGDEEGEGGLLRAGRGRGKSGKGYNNTNAPKEKYTKQAINTFFGDDIRTPDKGNKFEENPQGKKKKAFKRDPSFRDPSFRDPFQLVGHNANPNKGTILGLGYNLDLSMAVMKGEVSPDVVEEYERQEANERKMKECEENLEGTKFKFFPNKLEIYAHRALFEYSLQLENYKKWEEKQQAYLDQLPQDQPKQLFFPDAINFQTVPKEDISPLYPSSPSPPMSQRVPSRPISPFSLSPTPSPRSQSPTPSSSARSSTPPPSPSLFSRAPSPQGRKSLHSPKRGNKEGIGSPWGLRFSSSQNKEEEDSGEKSPKRKVKKSARII